MWGEKSVLHLQFNITIASQPDLAIDKPRFHDISGQSSNRGGEGGGSWRYMSSRSSETPAHICQSESQSARSSNRDDGSTNHFPFQLPSYPSQTTQAYPHPPFLMGLYISLVKASDGGVYATMTRRCSAFLACFLISRIDVALVLIMSSCRVRPVPSLFFFCFLFSRRCPLT